MDEIKFIATNHPNQEAKDKAGKRMLEAYREKDSIYEIKNILGDDRYSLKTRILAGEECLEVLSRLNKCEIDKRRNYIVYLIIMNILKKSERKLELSMLIFMFQKGFILHFLKFLRMKIIY